MMSDFEIKLGDAPRYAHVPPQPVALDAGVERHLAEIGACCSADTLLWVAALLDRIEPVDQRGRRDEAIRRGVRLCWCGTISASAKKFASRLQTYVVETYPRDQENGGPPEHASGQRLAMWDVVRFNGGDSLSWRQILTIAER
jgi:hypothetical protein